MEVGLAFVAKTGGSGFSESVDCKKRDRRKGDDLKRGSYPSIDCFIFNTQSAINASSGGLF